MDPGHITKNHTNVAMLEMRDVARAMEADSKAMARLTFFIAVMTTANVVLVGLSVRLQLVR